MMNEVNFSQLIDKYLSGELNEKDMHAVENLIDSDLQIRDEFELQSELQEALSESDIMELRTNLGSIAAETLEQFSSSASFSLSEEKCSGKITDKPLDARILINFYSALPKLHLVNHNISINENLHQLYKDQQNAGEFTPVPASDEFEADLPEGLQEALLERDIMDLREELMKISATLSEHDYSIEEIDKFFENEMVGQRLVDFEADLAANASLQSDVSLVHEVNAAIMEKDIMALRSNLAAVSELSVQAAHDPETIEQYVTDELPSAGYAAFEKEYLVSPELRAEADLYREVNEAIGEKDVIDLRAKLTAIREDLEESDVHPAVVRATGFRNIRRMVASAAAIALLLLGLGGVMRNMQVQPLSVYESSYVPYPSGSPPRAAAVSPEEMAFRKYENKQYGEALGMFSSLAEQTGKPGYRFYMGSCYQALGDVGKAIDEYKAVIAEGNSLFVRTAEWYLSLCYLKTGETESAREHLLAIVDRRDSYAKEAKVILRKMKKE